MRKLLAALILTSWSWNVYSEGSKNLTPSNTGVVNGTNTFVGYLEHDAAGFSGDFLHSDAVAEERVYVYIKAGETLYWGLRRVPTNDGNTNQDLTVVLYENDGTIANSWTLTDDDGSTNSASFDTPQNGVIESHAEAAAGPAILVGASGYDALSYTNNTGSDQDFYIAFVQFDGGSTNEANNINGRSWYDLWDFSVYAGTEEKTGRLHSQKWNFTAGDFNRLLSTDFQLFSLIPSTVGGVNAGYYVKEVDISGIDPYSVLVYANSTGADPVLAGTTDFTLLRQSQLVDNALIEYDLFINNPDLEIYPTSSLPAVTITDANIFCNAAGTGGEAVISFESNQTGQVAVIIDLNGVNGYQDGTADVIMEAEIASEGYSTIRWDGLDGNGVAVASGTEITITGRFTSGPLHVPLFDVEDNTAGIRMLDVRPATSFDLIFWDDSNVTTNQTPTVELDGSNSNNHNWTGTDEDLHNTWSFGYYQVNAQTIDFDFVCDSDGDGILGSNDIDSDNDGQTDSDEGDYLNDADADNIPDYLDEDIVGYVDTNGDGINDNYDLDLDGVVNALDKDSDNDGIPDILELGLTDADNDGSLDDGVGINDVNTNGLADEYDPNCASGAQAGNATAVFDSFTVGAPTDALGVPGATFALFDNIFDVLVLDIGVGVPAGETIVITATTETGGVESYTVEQSINGIDYSTPNTQTFGQNSTFPATQTDNYVLTNPARYLRFTSSTISATERIGIYGLSYSYTGSPCGAITGVAITVPDTDSDGVDNHFDIDSDNDGLLDVYEFGGTADANAQVSGFTDTNGNGWNDAQESTPLSFIDTDGDGVFPNYLDIDSDNDGILDNTEAQASNVFIVSVAGDANNNGLLDVYDPNNGGTLITPVDTDTDGNEDYIDTDADDDGVFDLIEGHDANYDGFGDWDATGSNNDVSDETGYNVDTDNDGLWDVFDTDNGGTAAAVQNSDGADLDNFQDTDDDNDGKLTAGEDANSNGDWTDDFTEGQGSGTPDYLYRGDYDGDAIADASDFDSDNDGISDATESNGESIDPSGDEDGDSVPNYRDLSDATVSGGLTSTNDINGDGVYDVFDSDLDGVPDFLDLDSDNDGMLDAIEANNGEVPFGLNESTGMFNLQDPDNDGLMNYIDSDAVNPGGNSTLANADSDGDGINDYRDIDSDGDGIVDIIEFQTTAGYIAASGLDNDGDGIDDSFDPNDGGTLISAINSDGADLADYLDDDSDNDGVLDIIEGDDTNFDGYGDWDTDSDNDITDEGGSGYGIDSDGDGLDDIFDTVALGSGDNATGTNTDLQNTDGTDFKDWRDSNDDNDGANTIDEDNNGNGNYADDQTSGQSGAIPDYLYNGDFDLDLIADASDIDSDNDGILDTDEANGEIVDPSGDADADGIPNFRDLDDPGVINNMVEIDSNGDGIWDNFDSDLDGSPDFKDLDSDNDGIPDLVEAGGVDVDGNGVIDGLDDSDGDGIPDNVDVDQTGGVDSDGDSIDDIYDFSVSGGTDTDGDDILDTGDLDIDGDGLANVYDSDDGGTPLVVVDFDGDGKIDAADLDSDNDGLPDIIEAGGTDADNDGKVDDLTDTDADGFVDSVDSDNGGSAYTIPDADGDGLYDYKDLDSDNDGITDATESRLGDTDGDGIVDNATDTDGDGWPDAADPDNGGTPAGALDDDNDGILNHQDLDADNDGLPDIVEAGGTDADNDGMVDDALDADMDGIPDNVDVTYFATNGGSGVDSDADGIDDSFDVDQTVGNDTDGDSIDNTFDSDADGNGLDDLVEANPYDNLDTDGDGNPDSHDLDSDNDGITNPYEYGQTVDPATGQLSGFTDANANGWNDAQEATPITPPDTDGDPFGIADFVDLDSDDDGIPDNIEAQNKSAYIGLSGVDTDGDGLDDAYDPDNGGTLLTPVNTDGTGDEDYLDTDADDDGVNDDIEGANSDRNQWADWDSNNNNDPTDETGWDDDVDEDGIFDLFDSYNGTGAANVIGSSSATQDSDADQIWDFQDDDDDNDGILTSAEATTPVTDPNGIIPDYLYGNQDTDGDGQNDVADLDADNDGLRNVLEDGGLAIDPSGDEDSDGLLNYQDADMDGDGIANAADTDADGDLNTDSFSLTDTNSDGVIDQFDKDLDGVPDFRDLDSDNDGIADIIEFGLTDADEDGTLDEGGGITDVDNDGLDDAYDPCTATAGAAGNATAVFSSTSVTNDTNVIGGNDNGYAFFDAGTDEMVIDLGVDIPEGQSVQWQIATTVLGSEITIEQSTDGSDFTAPNLQSYSFVASGVEEDYYYKLIGGSARYFRFRISNFAGGLILIDYLNYNYAANACGVDDGSGLIAIDTDSDGIDNYLDLDSDNDGISDNREAQSALTYVAPSSGDTDGDGILDVYDEDISAGNAIDPINSDAADNDDFLDTDSDNDGIPDEIEGWDGNSNGFADWDTDGDNDITDETGYNIDTDNDGIWNIFDSNSGLGSIANIDGSNQSLQDTDGDSNQDFRDDDDDEDGTLTSAEDTGDGMGGGADGDWTNDFTQGGGSIPDYLFAPDNDGDGVLDIVDLDSDNDGILNTDEYASAVYNAGGTPFDDADGDGIYNYLDDDDINNGSFVDVNNDNVDDQVDQDRDGIPNFFDLDSDNDGIYDAIEANDGIVPVIGGFDLNTGRFSGTDSSPNDGLVDAIAASPLNKDNLDGGALDDYLDLDSDNDGLTDNIESQISTDFVAPSGSDTDGDGLDDSFDNDNGGTPITPTNSDSTDEPDYRDTNSDNDLSNGLTIPDFIEGYDANRNGFSDLDSDLDGLISDETGYNTDTDGDGLWDLFDTYSGRGVNNINGSHADLQDTDGDEILDFRDTDDDQDNITTIVEDVDGDGIWTNDKTQGGGATPDYLYFNDSDKDLVADGQDLDGDQDGVLNDDEYYLTSIDPFGDADADGIYNYNDPDNPGGLTDSDGDGVWDEYDTDLDGVPNFFDLDSDNDGIPDLVENGGTDADGDGKLDGLDDADNDGLLDTYDVDVTLGTDVDGDGIDDAFQDGPDADGDGIEDDVDRDDDNDGLIDTIDPDEGGTALVIDDFDGDGIDNMFDKDSDNDGIVDLIEAGGNDANGDGILDTVGDTDGDGWSNLVDADNGGTALTIPNTDSADNPDYLDLDADDDGTFDYLEGFDDDEDDAYQDDYEARAIAYGNASHYNQLDMTWFNSDTDADDWPDFLDPDSGWYIDSDGDGIINLFDTDQGGDFYGNVSGKPDNDADGKENFIDKNGDFIVTPTFITTGEDGTADSFDVSLTLMPITDVVISIAITNAADEVSLDNNSLTFDNGNWNIPQTVTVTGENDALYDGDEPFEITVSVNDASSDDDYDDAEDQIVDGINEDNEGSIRVSTNTVTTTEGGTDVTFSVELSVQPATNVVVDIDDGSSDEGTVSPATLVFTSLDWDTPKDVTVSPQDDSELDGDQGFNITLSVNDALSDDAFDSAGDEVIAVTNEDDELGVVLSTNSVTTTEDGTTGSFTVVLDVMPATDVNITIAESSDEGDVNPTNITFDNGDWNIPQVITVTPADDVDEDGNQIYAITVSVDGTSDAAFLSVAAQTVVVTNEDDETVPLPLDFLSFSGHYDNEEVQLDWVTANEINVSHFEIEHGLDGSTFVAIGNTEAANVKASENDYSYTHGSPSISTNYYRIKVMDFDGEFTYSEIIKVDSPLYTFEVNYYPNPVDEMLTIETNEKLDNVNIQIISITGGVVLQQVLSGIYSSEFKIDVSSLKTGVYHVLINTNHSNEKFRILKK
ncbi:Por secretion system C-terminal sorting domain-containing protein [Reichenbachiella faecimaris]|uniref:Por secretion system C-terminal sorting domain-containing protein n=1 Tax=Reichenbachiella faecimaris TaxID=692418 RepID=A0A1W2G5K4_REIFA|nr:T9SS type A sorting domain-containing protein [Reichenbachiella faecimaris]SMD31950.1 Por secretion system C-terminal sorting domain-containing protein [Reichenbachiella faecimaris]